MKRRSFLNTAATGAAATTLLHGCTTPAPEASSSNSNSQPAIRWRMATSWPEALDVLYGSAQQLCQRVSEMTNGQFVITPYSAGELVGGLEVLDAVQSGAVQCGHTAGYYYTGKNPALALATALPFGLMADQQNAWLYYGGGLEALRQIYADFGILNFPAGNTGAQMGGWFKRPVQTLSDLGGLKMRIPGMGGKIMQELGVSVQVLPGGEIFLALERGAIDAAEWVGPHDDEKLGLQKAAQYYYYPGWWEPSATLEALVSQSAWNELPTSYQTAFATATYETNLATLAQYNALNGEALARLQADGVELVAYSPEILAAAEEASFRLYDQMSQEDAAFQDIYTGWKAFRDRIYAWNRINELPFAQSAYGS